QVVPSQRFSTPFPRQSISYYRALRRLNPSAFMFHMNLGAVSLVGSSPEILVRVRDGRVAIRPIAGTRPRSGDDEEDARRAEGLLNDPKEIAEHLMLLDLGRNDVGRVAAYGSVTVTEQFIVERYSHVMHIVSHVEGDLREGLDSVDALFAGFP
ncbi:MAG TPA: anthranilate synthase component I, partial [Hyphomonas sp.]|nr:anthranilate synthase component I [Hyphomonas sp.]